MRLVGGDDGGFCVCVCDVMRQNRPSFHDVTSGFCVVCCACVAYISSR